jgi:hypothetical protein
MDLEEIVKALTEHNATHPGHRTNCPCLDTYVVQLHSFVADPDKDRKVKQQLLSILRLVLQWDEMRGPMTGPLPKIEG